MPPKKKSKSSAGGAINIIAPPRECATSVGGEFRWCSKRFHIIYHTHLELEYIMEHWIKLIDIVNAKTANENADENHPHPHNHFIFEAKKRLQKHNFAWCWPDMYVGKQFHVEAILTDEHYFRLWKYLEKEGNFIQTGTEPTNTNFMEDCIKFIQSQDTFPNVLVKAPSNISKFISGRVGWAERIFNAAPKDVKDLMEGKEWFPWEHKLMELLNGEPHERHVIYVQDTVGSNGKTVFSKHLVLKYGAFLARGQIKDILYAYKGERIVIFDIERASEHISWAAVEVVKNGCFMNEKFYSGVRLFNIPHVVIMSNKKWTVYEEKLSEDRWYIIDLDKEKMPESKLNKLFLD